MDAALKAKWVEALRSGKYRQGGGALWRDGRHCCLGVLFDVRGLDWSLAGGGFASDEMYSPEPRQLLDVLTSDHLRDLTDRNDSGHTFEQIADHIEANL